MDTDPWRLALACLLAFQAALGLGYRIYRATKGGPVADVVGQAILAVVLLALSGATLAGAGWTRWAALLYGLLFGVVVMPVWALGVLIPMPPRALDIGFAVAYWVGLAAVVVAAVAA